MNFCLGLPSCDINISIKTSPGCVIGNIKCILNQWWMAQCNVQTLI